MATGTYDDIPVETGLIYRTPRDSEPVDPALTPLWEAALATRPVEVEQLDRLDGAWSFIAIEEPWTLEPEPSFHEEAVQ